MPSTRRLAALRDRLTAPRNVAILAAVAIPAAYAFHTAFEADQGDFLLLLALGVGVPTVHDRYGPTDGVLAAVAWVLGGCVVVGLAFVAVYVAMLSLTSGFLASAVAFLVAYLGPLTALWLWSQ